MKTTLEIPDDLFRRAKSAAAQKGIPLREFVTEAIAERLRPRTGQDKPWLNAFGGLRHLHKESARIERTIEGSLRTWAAACCAAVAVGQKRAVTNFG